MLPCSRQNVFICKIGFKKGVMSLFQWLTRRPSVESGAISAEMLKDRQDSEHPRNDTDRRTAQRNARTVRREQLYSVVRDAMVRVSILSAGYKFKVLSLDSTGQRFVVMVDLAHAYAVEPTRLREIEALIAELAKARMDAVVHAVYWRVSEQLNPAKSTRETSTSHAPLQSAVQQAHPAKAAQSIQRSFEPIDAQEMNAFKLAVAAAASIDMQPASHPRSTHRSAPLLGPGTHALEEARDFSASGMGSLGVTQYGELR